MKYSFNKNKNMTVSDYTIKEMILIGFKNNKINNNNIKILENYKSAKS